MTRARRQPVLDRFPVQAVGQIGCNRGKMGLASDTSSAPGVHEWPVIVWFTSCVTANMRPDATTGGPLTKVGKRQARRTAKRLCEYTTTRVYCSDLQRAKETAEIIARQLKVSVEMLPMLREIIPTRIPGRRVSLADRRNGRAKIDEAIARFLTRAPEVRGPDCGVPWKLYSSPRLSHPRAPATKWQQLGIFHCGITTFRLKRKRPLELQCFNEVSHLPSELRTSS